MKRGLITALVLLVALLSWSGDKELTMNGTKWFNTSNNCASQPEIDRVFGIVEFSWKGSQYYAVNAGNEIFVYKDSLVIHTKSNFNVQNVGDSDYDLMNFSVCDDCRYGVANYKAATVLFDLGTGARPYFVKYTSDTQHHNVNGSAVYMDGATEYAIFEDLNDECDGSALYSFTSTGAVAKIDCLERAASNTPKIAAGRPYNRFLFLADISTRLYVYEVVGGVPAYRSTIGTAYCVKACGFDVDEERSLLAIAGATGVKIYGLADPVNPTLLSTATTANTNRASISNGVLFACRKGFAGSEVTVDISSPTTPVPLDQQFWNLDNPWNYGDHDCAEIQAGLVSSTGETIVLARYSLGQSAAVTEAVDPSAIFADGFETGDTSRW